MMKFNTKPAKYMMTVPDCKKRSVQVKQQLVMVVVVEAVVELLTKLVLHLPDITKTAMYAANS